MFAAEDARIAQHLRGAERLLRRANVARLSQRTRRRRDAAIRALREYRLRGVFPRNRGGPPLTPVFIDEAGTRCAMAHLLESIGAHSLVARVAGDNNLARIQHLASDTELRHWLDFLGLTVEEAARVQPQYCESTALAECHCLPYDWSAVSIVYATGTGEAGGAGGAQFRVDEVLYGFVHHVGDLVDAQSKLTRESTIVAFIRDGATLRGFPLPTSIGFCALYTNREVVANPDLIEALTSGACERSLVAKYPRLAAPVCGAAPDASTTSEPAAPGVPPSRGACSFVGGMESMPLLPLVLVVVLRCRLTTRG